MNQEEIEELTKRAARAEGFLGFLLLTLKDEVLIPAEVINKGFPPGLGVYINQNPGEDFVRIGLEQRDGQDA